MQNVLQGTLSVLGGFLSLGVILLYLVFLLADFGRIKDNWQEYLPESWRGPVTGFAHEFEATMRLYFRGQVIIALLVGGAPVRRVRPDRAAPWPWSWACSRAF